MIYVLGWLVYSEERIKRNAAYARMHQTWCKEHGVDLHLVLVERLRYGIGPDGVWFAYDGKPLEMPAFAIVRCENLDVRRLLELGGAVVANGSQIGLVANDKLRTYELAHRLAIPYLEVFSPSVAKERSEAFPVVIKPRHGHGGEGVRLVHSAAELASQFAEGGQALKEDTWLCQRVAPVVGRDLRVYVLGGEVLAAMLRTASKDSFLSNYCRGGSAREYKLSASERALALKVARAMGDGYYGIDFLFDGNGGLLLNEIEDVVGSRMLYALTSIDVVDRHLSHVLSLCETRGREDAICR